MKLEWLEDLIAVLDASSLTEAAERRNVTQPAFTRRLRAIESHLGVALLDRRRKPARPSAALLERSEELRLMAANLRHLTAELSMQAGGRARLTVAAQHSLTLTHIPVLAARIRDIEPALTLRLRTGNWDECHAQLMTRQAGLMMAYRSPALPPVLHEDLVESRKIAEDRLCPVVAAEGLPADWSPTPDDTLPIVAYPPQVFLGQVVRGHLEEGLGRAYRPRAACETALVPAVRELALRGWGVAWLPRSLVEADLAEGRLLDLSERLGACPLDVVVMRLKAPHSELESAAWRALVPAASSP